MRVLIRLCAALTLVTIPIVVPAGPAAAAARVSIDNGATGARIDRTHMTTLRLQGHGFQSIRGGFGGIYVLFGTVSGNWRPSAHAGGSMAYVPDSQTKKNAGYQRFVAFPGDSTAASANGGLISGSGRWSTTINVPGSTFTAVGSDGRTRTVDCTKVTCGVITIGAHGVANRRNETFTPVAVADLYSTGDAGSTTTSTTTGDTTSDASGATGPAADPATAVGGKPKLRIDQASAGAGKVLGFTASGLPPGRQVSAVFDDGAAGVGPLTVGASGELAGVIQLPAEVGPGTHELRLIGLTTAPNVQFAVTGATSASSVGETERTRPSVEAIAFVAVAATLFLAALGFAIRSRRGRRRA